MKKYKHIHINRLTCANRHTNSVSINGVGFLSVVQGRVTVGNLISLNNSQ